MIIKDASTIGRFSILLSKMHNVHAKMEAKLEYTTHYYCILLKVYFLSQSYFCEV